MSFFDPLPDPTPERAEDVGRAYLAWPHEPPPNVVPVSLDAVVVLARTDDAAVFVSAIEVYPQGVHLRLTCLARPDGDRFERWAAASAYRGEAADLRFGMLLADGTKVVANVLAEGAVAPSHSLVARGGGGDEVVQRLDHWLWPLPPPGPIELVCSWPALGVDEARGVLDAGDLAARAAACTLLWPVAAASPHELEGSGWFMYAPLVGHRWADGRAGDVAAGPPPAIEPDTKDWTWVLGRSCPECGFDASAVAFGQVSQRLSAAAAAWPALLTERRAAARRPSPQVWSPLEYACHVRDVCTLFQERLHLMLAQDDPVFEDWDQDEAATARRYDLADAAEVSEELGRAAGAMAETLESVRPDQLVRPGRRSNGSVFTVDTLARYFLHDVVHHTWDVGRASATDRAG